MRNVAGKCVIGGLGLAALLSTGEASAGKWTLQKGEIYKVPYGGLTSMPFSLTVNGVKHKVVAAGSNPMLMSKNMMMGLSELHTTLFGKNDSESRGFMESLKSVDSPLVQILPVNRNLLIKPLSDEGLVEIETSNPEKVVTPYPSTAANSVHKAGKMVRSGWPTEGKTPAPTGWVHVLADGSKSGEWKELAGDIGGRNLLNPMISWCCSGFEDGLFTPSGMKQALSDTNKTLIEEGKTWDANLLADAAVVTFQSPTGKSTKSNPNPENVASGKHEALAITAGDAKVFHAKQNGKTWELTRVSRGNTPPLGSTADIWNEMAVQPAVSVGPHDLMILASPTLLKNLSAEDLIFALEGTNHPSAKAVEKEIQAMAKARVLGSARQKAVSVVSPPSSGRLDKVRQVLNNMLTVKAE